MSLRLGLHLFDVIPFATGERIMPIFSVFPLWLLMVNGQFGNGSTGLGLLRACVGSQARLTGGVSTGVAGSRRAWPPACSRQRKPQPMQTQQERCPAVPPGLPTAAVAPRAPLPG